MRPALVLLALTTLGCSESRRAESGLAATAAQAAPQDNEASLTIATFNINFGNVDLASIASTIGESGADLVFLQETNQESERYLKKELGGTYAHTYFSDSDAQWAAGGFGFLSKLAIETPRFIPAEHGLFGSAVADVKVHGRALRIVNIHLSPIRLDGANGFGDVLEALGQMEAVHKEEAAIFPALLVDGQPTIIAGDFNSTSSQVAPRTLAELGLVDAMASTTDKADEQRTWRWPLGGKEIGFRIDYVFHTNDLAATRSAIKQSQASDHHLLLTRLQWN